MNINKIKDIISIADSCGQVPLIKGIHGIGKSQSAEQYAKENNMHYEPLILSLMDTGDLLGIPVTHTISGMESTVWAAPSWYSNIVNAAWPEELYIIYLVFNDKDFEAFFFKNIPTNQTTIDRHTLNQLYCEYYQLPKDNLKILNQDNLYYTLGKRSLLNLDEVNRAPTDILNAILQLILDYRLHSHVLPTVQGKKTLIVAAINPSDQNYTVQEFDPALLDRFIECEATPDFPTWHKWATSNNVNSAVLDFLTQNQNKFHFVPQDNSKGSSPRSWVKLSTYINMIEENSLPLMAEYVKGTVGLSSGAAFIAFYNSYSKTLTFDQLDSKIKNLIKNNLDKNLTVNPEVISDSIKELVVPLDPINKEGLSQAFVKKYIKHAEYFEAMPLLVYLYSLPLENLAGFLKNLQQTSKEDYKNLSSLDKDANGKRLFLKLTSHLNV